jgi:hypothetical protein
MPRLIYSPEEGHQLLTAADTAAAEGADPALADLYRQLATSGIDLDACTPDETVREQLGMPPLAGHDDDQAERDGRGHDGGDHPHAA